MNTTTVYDAETGLALPGVPSELLIAVSAASPGIPLFAYPMATAGGPVWGYTAYEDNIPGERGVYVVDETAWADRCAADYLDAE